RVAMGYDDEDDYDSEDDLDRRDDGPTSEERTLAIFCHVSHFFVSFIGPLIIWLVKREESPYVDKHGKEAINFQLTMLLGMFVSFILMFVIIGFFTLMAIAIMNIVCSILAALKASEGGHYDYPMVIRFIR
ncbi:DUF4870 domain-containing protein, partial [Planctomycetota bacterium]|nr:DUF4870 domain-containing protein [Planctomycetota bacterium]